MKFRTEINIGENNPIISPSTKIFLNGSCFADNILAKLERLKFSAFGNPFGVLYNAASVYNQFAILKENKELTIDDLIFENGEWHSFYHNSEFSGEDPEKVLTKINRVTNDVYVALKDVNLFILTFGTSYVYEFNSTKMIVSNCHKIHPQKFTRKMLSLEENIQYIDKIVAVIKDISADAKIIMTVSPIRHLRDGLHQNQLSKASLLLAVDEIAKRYPFVEYFPSYEILLDDLRDYRFYASDLTHPSEEALNYIWDKFSLKYFASAAKEFAADMEKLAAAMNHRLINPESKKSKKFAESQLKYISQLKKKYPFLKFEEEEKHFNSILS